MNYKKLVTSALVAAVGAVLPQLVPFITLHLGVLSPVLLAALGVVLHVVPAPGTKEAVITSMLQGGEAATVQKVLDKEEKPVVKAS